MTQRLQSRQGFNESKPWILRSQRFWGHNDLKVDEENFGQTVSIELRPGGKETRVTDENKDEYIQVNQGWSAVIFSSCVNLFSIWLSTAGDWVEVYKQGEEADGSGKYDHDYRDDYNDYIDYVDQHYSDCDDYDDNCIFYSSSPVSTSLSPWTLSRLVIDHFNIHCWIWLSFDWVVEWNSNLIELFVIITTLPLQIFDEGELELLMCGIGSIDVKVISPSLLRESIKAKSHKAMDFARTGGILFHFTQHQNWWISKEKDRFLQK